MRSVRPRTLGEVSSRLSAAARVWVALGIVYVVWGSTYLAIREAVLTIPPFFMAGVRFVVAGAALHAWAARRGDIRGDPIGRRQWAAAALIGGLLLVGGNGGVAWAEQRVPTSVAALIIATVPLWMMLIAAWRGEDRVRARVAAGLALGFGGTALLVLSGRSSGGRPVDVAGVLVLIGAAISWALGSVLSRRAALPRRPLVATALEMTCGGALLLLLGLATGEAGQFHISRVSGASVAGLAYLVVLGSWVAFSAYVWLLRNAPTSMASTYAYVNPVIAVSLGWLFLNEAVTWLTLLSAALILSAVAMIVLAQSPRGRRPVVSPDGPTPPEDGLEMVGETGA